MLKKNNMLNKEVCELLGYRKNKYLSQAGEAGILEQIFVRLGLERGTLVEVGATDGLFLSNTKQFASKGWQCVYIESDEDDFNLLESNFKDENVINIHSHITPKGPNSLDELLSKANLHAVDLLILDIDSYDFEVIKHLKRYLPKVLMIEFNPFFKINERHQVTDPSTYSRLGGKGSSFLSMHELVCPKGYSIVCSLNMNAMYVRNDLHNKVLKRKVSLEESSTFEFQKVRSLTAIQIAQKIYYLGLQRVRDSIATKLGMKTIYQYPKRKL